ncbi:MAG: hypothetical protein SO009_01740 [Bacilli bacterium]|nr:hypothetical protein [Bacilli bacterium]
MKEMYENLVGFIYSLSMGDYFFFIGTFLLIVLFVYILYLIKCSDGEEVLNAVSDKKDDFDIEAVTKAIEKDYKPETIRLTSYEEEQENNAVISYEELLKNKDKISVSYDDEYEFEEPTLSVKKFDLTNTSETPVIDESKLKVQLMSYEKEEEFLKALKDLQSNLSH